jgi:diguanylate cyclase (GGDEF)-like protein
MVDSVTGSLQMQTDRNTLQTGDSGYPNQDIIVMENETMINIPSNEQAEMDDTSDDAGPGFESADMDSAEMDHQPEHESGIEELEISEFKAAAKEFNAAFDTALYELESSRKTIVERSIRIEELNESIKTVNVALNDEINKGHRKEDQYRLDTDQLNQRIRDIESERDRLHQLVSEHESTLNVRAEEISQISLRVEELTGTLEQRTAESQRAQEEISDLSSQLEELTRTLEQRTAEGQRAQEEISQLSSQVEELTGTLEQRTAEGQRAQEDFAHEQEILTERLNELQIQFANAGEQLQARQRVLEDRDKEIAHVSRQVNSLTTDLDSLIEASDKQDEAHHLETTRLGTEILELNENLQNREQLLEQRCVELESKAREIAWQNDHISELKDEIARLSDSMRVQSESHASACEEHAREAEQLNQRIHDTESERDRLQQQAHEQNNTLKNELEERENVINDKNNQVDSLTAELDTKKKEISWYNDHVSELEEAIETQSESMRVQSESHANTCEELNARIIGSSGELEALQFVHKELEAHVEKIENLNRALHESTISENTLRKKMLEDKVAENELLRTKLEAANELLKDQPDSTAATEKLQQALHDLESRLKETDTQNQVLHERAKAADALEAEVDELRTAVQEARDTGSQNTADAQSLQGQVTELQLALDNSRSEQEANASKLHDHEALEQEVIKLREAVQQADAGVTAVTLRDETERLKSALSASEQKCEQLQTTLSSTAESAITHATDQSPATQDLPLVAEIISRTQFVSHLDNFLAEQDSSGMNHTVMYALLDNFIRIRDEIGIMNSEHVINEIAGIITSQCNDEDIISRFGDCTFAILSCNESTGETQEKANRIRSMIENKIFESSGRSLVTTSSIGICSIRKNDTSAEEIVSRADLACEAARSSGGNQVLINSAIADEIFSQGTNSKHEEMVKRTLDEDRIKIYYQPISSLNDSSNNHYEVLIRIVDESGNIILPGEFFSMAANCGMTVNVDLYVIENIMKMMSNNDQDQDMKLFIKLTRQSVADHDLPLWLIGKIKEYSISPEHLVFEIAESVLQSDLKSLSMLSKAINAIGCKIAIEHYRLSTQPQHLLHIHADYLKIDSNLVENISRKGEILSKVTAIMDIARKHNYITIAEGVESPANLAILWELGVSFAQGYFIQAPAGSRDYDFQCNNGENEATESNLATFTIG